MKTAGMKMAVLAGIAAAASLPGLDPTPSILGTVRSPARKPSKTRKTKAEKKRAKRKKRGSK